MSAFVKSRRDGVDLHETNTTVFCCGTLRYHTQCAHHEDRHYIPGARVPITRHLTKHSAPFGQFEKIKGIATGEVDPKDRRNALITDIQFAPKNSRGRVEYRTNFTLVKPVDMSKSAGVLFYNIVNRGNHGGPAEFHVGGDPGDGFLYKMGEAILWSGWQSDIPLSTDGSDHEGIDVPIAPVTGPVWDRITAASGNTQSLPGAVGRTPASLDTSKAKLISAVSETPEGVKTGVATIAAGDWAFADCHLHRIAISRNARSHAHLPKERFQSGAFI